MASGSGNFKHGFPTPGPQDPTGHKVMDHVFFLSQSEFKHAREEQEYDIIIVGSGFCGLAVAERALENNPHCRILILERGTFFLPEHFQNLPLPFASTLGGLSETFPWTLSASTTYKETGVRWQHGMVPFFGGRSTLWSAWCPRPTPEEMHGWPEETITAAQKNFHSAERLLHVQTTDKVDNNGDEFLKIISSRRPVYGLLQQNVWNLLQKATTVKNIYRVQHAPLASDAKDTSGIDFQKYSVPGDLLALRSKQEALFKEGKGSRLDIATNCTIQKIHQQDGIATALETSRGIVPIGKAQLVLAMGTLPPTTLVRNSFPQLDVVKGEVGERFSAHFLSQVVARIPRSSFDENILFGDLEMGGFYIAGVVEGDYRKQFHIQLNVLSDRHPQHNAQTILRYMPDPHLVTSATKKQLESSKDSVIFVCAVLGELDANNPNNWFRRNRDDENETTNSILQVHENANDNETWDAMDQATFDIVENILSPNGSRDVQYWHGPADSGKWGGKRPSETERRKDALVHESSTLYIGENLPAPVDLDYRLRGAKNLFITGGGLWPLGGSWNPTMVMVAMAQHLADNLTSTTEKKGLLTRFKELFKS